jgi:Zn-dependent protease
MSQFLNPVFILSILIALSVHEAAHAYAAYKLGDDTARSLGRLTLNPIAHLDPLGTILFLMVGFGWGKPVPVNPLYFKHPKRDSAITALAGPLSNLILATVAFFALFFITGRVTGDVWMLLMEPQEASVGMRFLHQFLASSLFLNLGLMAFNLLPIAPLDGSKIIHPFIPIQWEDKYEDFLRYGPYLLLGLLVAERIVNIHFLSGWIGGIMNGVLAVFTQIALLLS